MKTKTLTTEQALYCANIFNDYFGKFRSYRSVYERSKTISNIRCAGCITWNGFRG